MNVDEAMTREPYAAQVTSSIREVLDMLAEADIRHIPIVEDGALVGIVSDRDLRALAPGAIDEFEHPDEVRKALAQPISSVMNSDVVSVSPESDLTEAIDLMIEQKVGAVPVVESDSSRLVGIVSYVDVLRVARDSI